jgi:Pentapeptide repeats (8 copies)
MRRVLSQIIWLTCLGFLVSTPIAAQQEPPDKETCPHPKDWKPTNDELRQVLSEHRLWVVKEHFELFDTPPAGSEGRANLCNADLRGADLEKANLAWAVLNNANLFSAKLNEAILFRAAEGIFRKIAFDLTTRYGLDPARALLTVATIWALLIPVYSLPIWRRPRPKSGSGIYRIWPKDRVEVRDGKPTLDNAARVERLHSDGVAILGWSAYFSLLSAFQIGFREFNVGTWLTRAQPHNFESTGWIRSLAGLQSLLSVYLFAMWLLTYFGRPFQ